MYFSPYRLRPDKTKFANEEIKQLLVDGIINHRISEKAYAKSSYDNLMDYDLRDRLLFLRVQLKDKFGESPKQLCFLGM